MVICITFRDRFSPFGCIGSLVDYLICLGKRQAGRCTLMDHPRCTWMYRGTRQCNFWHNEPLFSSPRPLLNAVDMMHLLQTFAQCKTRLCTTNPLKPTFIVSLYFLLRVIHCVRLNNRFPPCPRLCHIQSLERGAS